MANQRATTTRSVHSCAKRQTFPLQKNSYQLDVKIHIYHKNIYERRVVFKAYNLVFCLQPVLTTCSIKQVNFFSPFYALQGCFLFVVNKISDLTGSSWNISSQDIYTFSKWRTTPWHMVKTYEDRPNIHIFKNMTEKNVWMGKHYLRWHGNGRYL